MFLTDISDIPAPDILSASSRSLSGSPCTFEASDLFLRIDLERRCDSKFGDASIESIDSDNLFSDLPEAIKSSLWLFIRVSIYSTILPLDPMLCMPNRC